MCELCYWLDHAAKPWPHLRTWLCSTDQCEPNAPGRIVSSSLRHCKTLFTLCCSYSTKTNSHYTTEFNMIDPDSYPIQYIFLAGHSFFLSLYIYIYVYIYMHLYIYMYWVVYIWRHLVWYVDYHILYHMLHSHYLHPDG